ncbi:MAG: hypothetical protein IJL39_04475 [Clostridia bacterium]|jgi:hypothetical protein|nr:hypothetical protein [Clostridia bacterium]MBQ6000039.1 hypothetical protein [Clostridia bacterium]MBQ6059291.1 hypothetical protein [Clostridia bacterium]
MKILTEIFETPGEQNTARTLELAVKGARELGISTIVVASCSGRTVDALLEQDLTGLRPVVVTHAYGFYEDGENELPEEKRRQYLERGIPVCTAGHPLSGAERSLSGTFGAAYPVEIMAHTLRLFGQGTKVCVESCAIAADAGAIRPGEPVIAVGGTGGGVDTALVLRPAHTNRLLQVRLDYFLCKPKPAEA